MPEQVSIEDLLRVALEAIANSEIPGVSGGPHGPSVEVMEFARRALRRSARRGAASVTKPANGWQCSSDRVQRCEEVNDAASRESGKIEALREALIPFVFIGRAQMERLGLAEEHDHARRLLGLPVGASGQHTLGGQA